MRRNEEDFHHASQETDGRLHHGTVRVSRADPAKTAEREGNEVHMEREHFSKQYDAELNEIREKLLTMGGKVEVMLANAMKALVDRDSELARRTIAFDHEINHLEMEIDEKCLQVLALRQPAAR